MSGLSIQAINKSFGPLAVLKDISLTVDQGQFVCLLGPSGCGKSTLLRIIAGLDQPSSGDIIVDGETITGKPAHLRDFGMVFQSLALFPHLSVGENIAYPLRIRGVDKKTRQAEVERLLDLVHLPGIAGRAVNQLSGGQRQRVAIARALALKPKLFLLDEPMSALDAKLREAMQVELKRLQQELGITTFLVTHDQREAMTMADLVVVMSKGVIQQAAPPLDIYRNPANDFVADFIGATNLIEGEAQADGTVRVPGGMLRPATLAAPGRVVLSVRPEDLDLTDVTGPDTLAGTVSFVRHLGASVEISVNVPSLKRDILISRSPRQITAPQTGQHVHVRVPGVACIVVKPS